MRKKGDALNEQATAYKGMAKKIDPETLEAPEEKSLVKVEITYLEDILILDRKELDKYVVDHEKHLAATTEKLRSEMIGLGHYVQKAEKRLRDQIQLKVATHLNSARTSRKSDTLR